MIDWIILIIILLFFGIIAFLSLKSNITSVSNRNFAYLIIMAGFWILFNFLENEIYNLTIAQNLLILDFVLAALMVYFFLIFALYFTGSKLIGYKSIFVIYTLFVILIVFINFVIVNIRFENHTIIFDQGLFYYLYAIQPFLYVIVGLSVFISKYLKSAGLYRLQLTYIILGLFLAALLGLISNLILPQLGITDISILRLGIYGMVFFIWFTSYAILKYRLMDIRVIIRRSAVFTVLVSLITAIYALIAYVITLFFQDLIGAQSVILNGIVTAVLVAIGFEPLKKGLSQITDTFLFKAEYKPQEVLAELLRDSGEAVVLIKPQFEVGKKLIQKGVVRDPALHKQVIDTIKALAIKEGLTPLDIIESPIKGVGGNKEFLLYLKKLNQE